MKPEVTKIMSTPNQVSSYKDILGRVRAMQAKSAAAQGDKVTDVKDPSMTGTVTPPTHPSEGTTNSALPGGNPMPDNSAAPKSIESTQTAGTLQGNAISTTSGDAKDKAVDSPTAKLASDVQGTMTRIKALLNKQAAEEKPTDSKAKAADPTDKGTVTPTKKNGPEDLPAAGAVATAKDNGADKAAAAVEATANDIQLSSEAYIKLAQHVLAAEGGIEFSTRIIKEAKGAAVAQELISNALAAQEQFQKQAAAEVQGAQLAEHLFKSASADDQALMIKWAQVHGSEADAIDARTDLNPEEKEMCKRAYAQGAMDGAAMEDTGELPGGASPEPSPEEIMAVIEQLVASGQLPEEVAQQLMAELSGQGAPGAEGAAAPAEGAEGAVEEATEEEKQAAAKDPILVRTGAFRKSASASDKLAAEILQASYATAA
jgi:hypothetical protein